MKAILKLLGLLKSFQITIDGTAAEFVSEFSKNITSNEFAAENSIFSRSSEDYLGFVSEKRFKIRRVRFSLNPMSKYLEAEGTVKEVNNQVYLNVQISLNTTYILVGLVSSFAPAALFRFNIFILMLTVVFLMIVSAVLYLNIGEFQNEISAEMVLIERQMKLNNR